MVFRALASLLNGNTRSYKVRLVLHLYGVPVTPENARHLVATLIADGSPHALSAANEIQKGLDRQLYAVGLERVQRDAILAVLDPPGGLEELRGCWREIIASACSRRCSSEITPAQANAVGFSGCPATNQVIRSDDAEPDQPERNADERRTRLNPPR